MSEPEPRPVRRVTDRWSRTTLVGGGAIAVLGAIGVVTLLVVHDGSVLGAVLGLVVGAITSCVGAVAGRQGAPGKDP